MCSVSVCPVRKKRNQKKKMEEKSVFVKWMCRMWRGKWRCVSKYLKERGRMKKYLWVMRIVSLAVGNNYLNLNKQ